MTSRMAIRGALGIGVSVIAVILLLSTVDLSAAAGRFSALQPAWLLLPFLGIAAQLGLRSWRWAYLLRLTAGAPVRARRMLGPLTVSYLANALLPARLGEVARAVLVARRETLAFPAVVASVVAERVLDLVALLGLGIATAGAATIGTPAVVLTVLLIVGLAMAIRLGPAISRLLARFVPAVLHVPIGDFLAALGTVGLRSSVVVTAVSAVAWLSDVLLMWSCARALGIELGLSTAVAIAVGAALGTALPAASGYIGTYELGAVTLGTLAGMPSDSVLAVAVLAHVIAVVPTALLGALTVAGTGLPLSRKGDEPAGARQAPV